MNRSIVCLTVPAFPIAVERAVSRKLYDRPLILARSCSSRALCLSVSKEAAAFGIRRGMMLNQARRSCRDLAVIYPNPPLYWRAMNAMHSIVSEYSPLVEPFRPGQNYMDMTGSERLFGKAVLVAELLRQRFANELRLPAEAGLSVNKLVSRVAAFDASPEGLLEVHRGSEEPFMEPHRINVLPAADRKTRTQLIELNVKLIQELKGIKLDTLLQALGPVAFSLSRQARGIDLEPVTPPNVPPRLVLAEELKEDTNEWEIIDAAIKRLTIEGSFQLNRSRQTAAELMLYVVYSDGQTSLKIKRLRKHTNSTSIWLKTAEDLVIRTVTRRVRIRRIELTFSRLSTVSQQLDLTETFPDEHMNSNSPTVIAFANRKSDRALQAIEKLQARFGSNAVMLGVTA